MTYLLSLNLKEDKRIVVNIGQIGAMIPESDGTTLFVQGIKVFVNESMDEIIEKYNSLVN